MSDHKLISPINGGTIRHDPGGAGHYGAPRAKQLVAGGILHYLHKGTDYVCIPGELVKMPCTGIIKRHAYPYADKRYDGVEIQAKRLTCKLFYLKPFEELIGTVVQIGQVIGIAQDISLKYGHLGVMPHVHMEITRCDPEIFMSTL